MVSLGGMAVAAAATAVEAPDRRRLRPVELLLLGYVGIVSVVALARVSRFAGCGWLLLAHALIVVLVFLVTRPGLGPVGRGLREAYPLVLLVALYGALDVLNGGGAVPVSDGVVQRWELALFGEQVSRTWWREHPSAFWSSLLHGAYLSYYLILCVPAAILAWRRQFQAVRHFVLLVMATFFVCYLFFIFMPVAGPYYTFDRPSGEFVANLPAQMVYRALAGGSSYGAAFPSSHVAATLAATVAAYRGSRPLGLALVIPAALLTVSVVYCQMHYAVDAIAGVAVGAGVAWIGGKWDRRVSRVA